MRTGLGKRGLAEEPEGMVWELGQTREVELRRGLNLGETL